MDPSTKQEAKYSAKNLMGYISDKTTVGMAKIRGEEGAQLDVAIIKATLQDEVVPKEKHVRTLKIACSGSAPRQQVNYVIHGLSKRLEEKGAWLVTLKALIVFHRLFRETDVSFQEELLRYCERTGLHRMLRLDSFADHTTKETWDYSAWIRVYSVYLDERLALFRAMKFEPEHDQGVESRETKLKSCPASELLELLPQAQKLLSRLISCVPEGSAQQNDVPLEAARLVLKEVRPIYKLVCEGIINLADKFFEMERGDALKGLEIYKENVIINDKLNNFFGTIQNIPPLRGNVQFPAVQALPPDFLTTMEEYVRDAPKTLDANGSARRAGNVLPPAMMRSSSHAVRGGATSAALGGPKLIVGGPINETKSGPSSPDGTAPAPAAPAVVDLLDFDSLSMSPAPPAAASPQPSPVAAPPAAPAPGVFDPFGSLSYPAPGAASTAAPQAQVPAPVPQQQQQQAPAQPPTQVPPAAPAGFGDNAFGAPAPAAPAPPAQPAAAAPPPAFGDSAFGFADNAFGGGAAAAARSLPAAAAPAAAALPPPFNPFGAPPPAAPMPTYAGPQAAAAPFPPQPAQPAPYMGQPQPGPQGVYAPPPPANMFGAPPAVPMPVPSSNPFGANPFAGGMPVAAAAPPNPFGGTAPPPVLTSSANNPFGGSPWAGAGAGAPAQAPVLSPGALQTPYNYSMKKDPLMDLSVDIFGKPQAPPVNPSLRDMKAQNVHGSPI